MSKAQALSIIENTSLPKPKTYSKFNSFDDADRILLKKELTSEVKENGLVSNDFQVLEVDPNLVEKWEYKDRQGNELGDIPALAKELKELGQQFPCVVRKNGDKFELIAGERRWCAAKLAGIKLKVTVRNFKNDEEAVICQYIENEGMPISEYSRGMHFSQLIEDGIIKQATLTEKLGISRQEVSRLLAYRDIPRHLKEAIGDLSKVSARTAAEIRILCNKDAKNIDALISIGSKIASGIGANTLLKEVTKYFEPDKAFNATEKVFTKSGRHLFTWRKDGNGNVSISFPKNVRERLVLKDLEHEIMDAIHKQLNEVDA